jgi:uncharacterized protein YjlB
MDRLEHYFFADDGIIPNNPLPVVIYREVAAASDLSAWLEKRFTENNWTNNWRDIVLPYDHYHSSTHEVLGLGKGVVRLQIGGAKGRQVEVHAGDVLILPAGVGHFSLDNSQYYQMVGGYPGGADWDLLTGELEERPSALERIARLPIPQTDPIYGSAGPLFTLWK